MIIRKSKPEESNAIASCIALAMKDIIYHFIGEDSAEKAIWFLNTLIQEKGNQYSYENCWVVESENEIVAAAIVYDGARLKELRKPVANAVKLMFNREFHPEDETQAGEHYIDCIGVNPNQQGKGIGTKVLKFLINAYVHQKDKTLGLLADKKNPRAKQLYLKLGFEIVDEKILAGNKMDHLQYVKKTTSKSI
jgi:ribosomal protein S18 acetylase RimI-like enzyme